MSCHAEASVDLPLAPQAAWDVVMDWNGQSAWMLFTRVWATGQDGQGVGGGVAARTSVGPLGFTDDMVITHWDPPRECTVKHLGTIVRGTGTFAIRAPSAGSNPTGSNPTGSTFVWSEDVIPPLGRLGSTAWPLIRPAFELMMRISLKRLAAVVAR
ncbi:SRPBCC family protein [Streptomyces sp. SID13031]|uniref:SRPBCC family protein n=1 Tax=Streptomyces sp. SID13031 TaxID=2706046 RepID=UPI0013CD5F60|nr:SRPBCC family protein [Streptomyces sp. SID13031]NEA32197.1 SRPBCC family protein [Streptomyces sp. SID13031]